MGAVSAVGVDRSALCADRAASCVVGEVCVVVVDGSGVGGVVVRQEHEALPKDHLCVGYLVLDPPLALLSHLLHYQCIIYTSYKYIHTYIHTCI